MAEINWLYVGNGTALTKNGYGLCKTYVDPLNPLDLPAYTIRLQFTNGFTPRFTKGTAVRVSSSPNVWDLTYNNTSWRELLKDQTYLIAVLGANSTGVTNMNYMLDNCQKLESVALFDTSTVTTMIGMFEICMKIRSVPHFNTSNVTTMSSAFMRCDNLISVPLFDTHQVTDMYGMLSFCYSLTSVPLFDTSQVTDMRYIVNNCYAVEHGALALYQQASTQSVVPNHYQCFTNCGRDTVTGSAELAQIPQDWGGTMP